MHKLLFREHNFERLVRDRHGRLFRVRFVVVERDGNLRGRVISVAPITALQKRFKIYDLGFKNETLCLPAWLRSRQVKDKGLRIKDLYFSPYFNKFDFLTVIKIRAPSTITYN